MILKSFRKEDSGLYGCATYQSNSLVFGKMTGLVAGELTQDFIRSLLKAFQSSFKYICVFYSETIAPPQPTVAATTAKDTERPTSAACVCDEKGRRLKVVGFGFTKIQIKGICCKVVVNVHWPCRKNSQGHVAGLCAADSGSAGRRLRPSAAPPHHHQPLLQQ